MIIQMYQLCSVYKHPKSFLQQFMYGIYKNYLQINKPTEINSIFRWHRERNVTYTTQNEHLNRQIKTE